MCTMTRFLAQDLKSTTLKESLIMYCLDQDDLTPRDRFFIFRTLEYLKLKRINVDPSEFGMNIPQMIEETSPIHARDLLKYMAR